MAQRTKALPRRTKKALPPARRTKKALPPARRTKKALPPARRTKKAPAPARRTKKAPAPARRKKEAPARRRRLELSERANATKRQTASKKARTMGPGARRGRKITDIAVRHSGRWFDNVGRRLKPIWVHISPGYLYLAHESGRAYWVLRNIPPRARPNITFSERGLTMGVNTFRVRFSRPADFEHARRCLGPFARRGDQPFRRAR